MLKASLLLLDLMSSSILSLKSMRDNFYFAFIFKFILIYFIGGVSEFILCSSFRNSDALLALISASLQFNIAIDASGMI